MKKNVVSRVALGFGIALLASALASTVLVGGTEAGVQAVLGLAAIAFYFATNRGALGRTFAGRATLFYGVSGLTAVLLVAFLVAANFVAANKKITWDLTADGIHTLADDTVKTLRGLTEEVKVTAFFGAADPMHDQVKELLDRYQAESDKLVVEFVDPWSSPQLVQEKGIREGGPRVIFSHGASEARAAEVSEESFTNALVKVLRKGEKKVYVVAGHGERDYEDAHGQQGYGRAAKALADEGLTLQTLHLTSGDVPADAAAVLILGPQKPFFEPEVEALRKYLADGGRLFVALEPGHDDPALEKLLEEHGFLFDDGIVVDPLSRLMGGGAAIPVVQTYADHETIRGFALATLFPTARSITARGDATPRPTVLALTNPSAWAELDMTNPQAQYDQGEKRGQLGLAAVLGKKEGDKETRIFAVGDVDFASNQFSQQGGNGDFFLNAVNWLASQEDRITIRPKTREASRLVLTEADARLLNLVSINVLPMLVLGAGMSVWLVRRGR